MPAVDAITIPANAAVAAMPTTAPAAAEAVTAAPLVIGETFTATAGAAEAAVPAANGTVTPTPPSAAPPRSTAQTGRESSSMGTFGVCSNFARDLTLMR